MSKTNPAENLFRAKHDKADFIIAGPCSAETEYQTLETARQISACKKVKVFRAGIWKPRTSPGNFEGVGEIAFNWLRKIKKQTELLTATEAATPEHIEQCLKNRDALDIIWIGARTTANPFSVQALADALKGTDIPVLIKNPLNPDIKLWAGAVERFKKAGIKHTGVIHRGFSPFENTHLRNLPKWELAIEIKSIFPEIPIINDPSHIAGNRKYIKETAQKALNLNFDGLMIETHITPHTALSDAKQQITPETLKNYLKTLKFRKSTSEDSEFRNLLEQYREQINSIDYQLLELLNKRMKITEKIGRYKLKNNVSIFQLKRWLDISETRQDFGKTIGLDEHFIKKILQLVHRESIRIQSKIMNSNKKN
ncbi:MAG: bifunctional 3-deoxy-7-phosphoheptulonate synthase/chorismate mutase type II [Chlorobi bacterium]|nr:bifunctional 3-deoxy-7-phosphoheptulonate synthase/chorismate mutase type II [Chlorobiota bacterium]